MTTDYTINGKPATSDEARDAIRKALTANKKSCDCGRPYLGHYIGTVVLGKDIGVTVMP
jgi:hypothetical protein